MQVAEIENELAAWRTVPEQLFRLDASQNLMDLQPGSYGRLRHFVDCSSGRGATKHQVVSLLIGTHHTAAR